MPPIAVSADREGFCLPYDFEAIGQLANFWADQLINGQADTLAALRAEEPNLRHARVLALRQANIYEPHVYCHIVAAPRVWRETGALKSRANFLIVRTMANGESSIFASGVSASISPSTVPFTGTSAFTGTLSG